jgi:hypothetical protein
MPLVAWIAVVIVAALAGSLTGVAFWFLKGVAATGLASKKARVIGKVIATAIAGCGVLAVTALFFIDWEKLMAPPAAGAVVEEGKETPAEEAAEEEAPTPAEEKIPLPSKEAPGEGLAGEEQGDGLPRSASSARNDVAQDPSSIQNPTPNSQ